MLCETPQNDWAMHVSRHEHIHSVAFRGSIQRECALATKFSAKTVWKSGGFGFHGPSDWHIPKRFDVFSLVCLWNLWIQLDDTRFTRCPNKNIEHRPFSWEEILLTTLSKKSMQFCDGWWLANNLWNIWNLNSRHGPNCVQKGERSRFGKCSKYRKWPHQTIYGSRVSAGIHNSTTR